MQQISSKRRQWLQVTWQQITWQQVTRHRAGHMAADHMAAGHMTVGHMTAGHAEAARPTAAQLEYAHKEEHPLRMTEQTQAELRDSSSDDQEKGRHQPGPRSARKSARGAGPRAAGAGPKAWGRSSLGFRAYSLQAQGQHHHGFCTQEMHMPPCQSPWRPPSSKLAPTLCPPRQPPSSLPAVHPVSLPATHPLPNPEDPSNPPPPPHRQRSCCCNQSTPRQPP